ncbi:MAG: type IV pilus modification PilV family protein [Bacillota bacterium]
MRNQMDEKGLGFVEVIIAIFIMGMVVVWSSYTMTANLRLEIRSRMIDEAAKIASSAMDDYRSQILRGNLMADMSETANVAFLNRHYIRIINVARIQYDPNQPGLTPIYSCTVKVYAAESTDPANTAVSTKIPQILADLSSRIALQVEQ